MKKLTLLIFTSIFIFACKTSSKKSDRNIIIGDTITTKSGLKYFFLKEGLGRKIEPNSKVKIYTDLFLNDADTTIWKTSTASDSLFTFIHQKTPLIKGFDEVHNYLKEGDEIIAILPDSLAYGKNGNGNVPPNATLIYKPLIVKFVSKPKKIIADTLIVITKNKGANEATSFYEKIANGKEADKYHLEPDDLSSLFTELRKDSLFVELENVSSYFLSKTKQIDAKQNLAYNLALAYINQEKIIEAIKLVEPLTKEKVNQDYWINTLNILKKELKAKQ